MKVEQDIWRVTGESGKPLEVTGESIEVISDSAVSPPKRKKMKYNKHTTDTTDTKSVNEIIRISTPWGLQGLGRYIRR